MLDRTTTIPPTGFASPRTGVDVADCNFYQHMTFPDGKDIDGAWDLRPCVNDYLGRLDYSGKRVLEIGPASGFLTFEMERRGAMVTAIELSRDYLGDIIPIPGKDHKAEIDHRRSIVERTINSFWYGAERTGSAARVYHGDAKQLPPSLGPFDIGTFGAVLLHSREPTSILLSCAEKVTQHIVVVDAWHDWMDGNEDPAIRIAPSNNGRNNHTWWQMSPAYISRVLAMCNFSVEAIYRFDATHQGAKSYPLYSLVAKRL